MVLQVATLFSIEVWEAEIFDHFQFYDGKPVHLGRTARWRQKILNELRPVKTYMERHTDHLERGFPCRRSWQWTVSELVQCHDALRMLSDVRPCTRTPAGGMSACSTAVTMFCLLHLCTLPCNLSVMVSVVANLLVTNNKVALHWGGLLLR